jgi:hypothetical protein
MTESLCVDTSGEALQLENSAQFALALHVGEQGDDCQPHATARLVLAAAAIASSLPSEVAENLKAHLRRAAQSQFPICYPEIKLGNPLSSALIAHYSSLRYLPYPAP